MSQVALESMAHVGRELSLELDSARRRLELYLERGDNLDPLVECADTLHEVHGVLSLVELYGAAQLADEMEKVARHVVDSRAAPRSDALEVLSRALVQLPMYLDHVLAGARDVPFVLLPLLNDLRTVRGAPLLNENTLFLLNISHTERPPEPASEEPHPFPLAKLSRELRPRFQASLLGWITGNAPRDHLRIMLAIAIEFEETARTTSVHRLWRVVGALLEGMRDGGLETGATVKRLLGQVDQVMKRIAEVGEAAVAESPPDDLVNNILYYVGRSRSTGTRVKDVKRAFDLDKLLPDPDEVKKQREGLAGPSPDLMRTVGAAIKDDLSQVKDGLDIFVRTGCRNPEELQAQRELLKKVGDTLSMLGLGHLRRDVEMENARLARMVTGTDEAGEDAMLEIAGTLLQIEDRLDKELLKLIDAGEGRAPDAGGGAEDAEFREVLRAVVSECLVNLARVKEAIVDFVAHPEDANALEDVSGLMRGIRSAMLLLERERVADLISRIGDYVQHHIRFSGKPPGAAQVECVADAIVSVEYYMETLKAGRTDPWYMLDNAESCMRALRTIEETPRLRQPREELGVVTQIYREGAETTQHIKTTQIGFEPTRVVPPTRRELEVFSPGERSDPEFLELFIEEAKEEADAIRAAWRNWQANETDKDALQTLRRSFHTLKGSGRMVGAQLIGEFAWSIENMLNRVIDGTLASSDELEEVMSAAISTLPELIEQLEVGTEPGHDVRRVMGEAWRLAEGREVAEAAAAEQEPAAAPAADEEEAAAIAGEEGAEQAQAAVAIEMDAALLEIFSKETSGHLDTVRDYIGACEQREPPHALTEDLRRAVHTLHGSANMASVAEIVAIAGPLDHYVSECFNGGQRIPRNALAVLAESADMVEALVAGINQAKEVPDSAGLQGRIRDLQAAAGEPEVPTEGLEVGEFEVAVTEDEGDTIVTSLVEILDMERAQEADEAGQPAEAEPEAAGAEPEHEAAEESEGFQPFMEPETGQPAAQAEPEPEPEAAGAEPEQEAAEESEGFQPFMEPETADAGPEQEAAAEESEALPPLTEGEPGPEAVTEEDSAWQREQEEAPQPQEPVKYDPDIAGIFADEATELLEAADARLLDWRTGGDRTVILDDLKRQLHTLKGGARMAGISEMGDLSHELESLLNRQGAGEAGHSLFGVIQESLDRLHRMRDQVSDVRPVADAEELVNRIRVWTPESTVPEAEPEEATEVSAPESGVVEAVEVARAPEEAAEETAGAEEREETEESGRARAETDAFAPPVIEPVRASFGAPTVLVAPEPAPERQERARVDAELLQSLLDNAGEISIFRSRLEQQMSSVGFNLAELAQTVTRLRDQLRKLEIETEAQILFRHQDDEGLARGDFDPLEMDRYSTLQQLSRSLAETTDDLMSIQGLLENLAKDSETLLVQQSRVTSELQHGLMRTRMVPFQQKAQRLGRLVRQTAGEVGKRVELHIEGGQGEMDRQVLERMMPALEHMLRNAVIHGIEDATERARRGKPDTGQITMRLRREGSETVIDLGDDGRGLDLERIKERAAEAGFVSEEKQLSDEDVMQLIFEPGLTTAEEVTQTAGRGVGMDVVANEVRQLGGSVHIDSRSGRGTRFTIRLPFTLAISQALLVTTGEETYALPLTTVEGVTRIPRAELERRLASDSPTLEYGGREYPLQYLGALLGAPAVRIVEEHVAIPVVLVRAGEQSAALITDDMLGGREIVVKSVGPQLARIRGISGATILGDGSTVLILDLGALIRTGAAAEAEVSEAIDQRTFVLVVDDSITVRRVTQRLLERNGMRVMTAKDGVDAVTLMQEHKPDIILLDIEMPRMDGYEVAAHVRDDPRLQDVPIVMITSRVGLKHRARAIELGVNDYLGKPYQESQLLEAIEPLVSRERLQ